MDHVSLNAVRTGYMQSLPVPFCDSKLGAAAWPNPIHPLVTFMPSGMLNASHRLIPGALNGFSAVNNDTLKANNGLPNFWNPLLMPWLGPVPDYSSAGLNSGLPQAHQLNGLMQMTGNGENFLKQNNATNINHPHSQEQTPDNSGEKFLETLYKINSSLANNADANSAKIFHSSSLCAPESFVTPDLNSAIVTSRVSPPGAAADRSSVASLQRVSTSSSPASNDSSSRSNLATLAEVACRLTPERASSAAAAVMRLRTPSSVAAVGCPIAKPSGGGGVDCIRSQPLTTEIDPSLINASTMAWAALTSQLLAAAEMQDHGLSVDCVQSRELKHCAVDSIQSVAKTPDSVHFLDHNQTNKSKDCDFNGNEQSTGASACVTAKRRQYRRKSGARIASETLPSNEKVLGSIEDTIDSVIRLHSDVSCSVGNLPKAIPSSQASRKPTNHQLTSANQSTVSCDAAHNHVTPSATRDLFSNRTIGCASQAQNSNKRPSSESRFEKPSVVSTDGEILDLSVRKRHKQSFDQIHLAPVSTNNLPSSSNSAIERIDKTSLTSTTLCRPSTVGRRTVDADVARRPLSFGWRRQTCVRAISASGVRGDVLYYSPCGRKFASVAEIARYLKKQSLDKQLSVDCFTFSSKVLVGEFFFAAQGGIKNMSESDVKEMISDIQRANLNGKPSIKKIPADFHKFLSKSPALHEDHFNAVNYGLVESGNSVKNVVYNLHVDYEDEIEESVACCIIDLINRATSASCVF